MIPSGISHHQSPFGHLLAHPHYVHRGPISGLASVSHGIRLGGTGTSASGVYGSQSSHGYHSTGYGGQVGMPSGGHQAPAGYDYHPGTAPHTPIVDATGPIHSTGKGKSTGSSTMTALTLLSFLFFLNMLQGCLKEHMDTMNPTVMVMTAGVGRNRVSKLAEMNSREQQNPVSQILPRPVLTMNIREPVGAATSINEDQNPFSDGNTKIEYTNSNNQRPDPEPEYYSPSSSSYANRTMTQADNNYQDRHHYTPYRHYQRLSGSLSSVTPSPSPSSSFSSVSNSGGNNYYSDTMDPFYMRIN